MIGPKTVTFASSKNDSQGSSSPPLGEVRRLSKLYEESLKSLIGPLNIVDMHELIMDKTNNEEELRYTQELDDESNTQWKGIILSILVILMVFGGICLSAFIIQPRMSFTNFTFLNFIFDLLQARTLQIIQTNSTLKAKLNSHFAPAFLLFSFFLGLFPKRSLI